MAQWEHHPIMFYPDLKLKEWYLSFVLNEQDGNEYTVWWNKRNHWSTEQLFESAKVIIVADSIDELKIKAIEAFKSWLKDILTELESVE